MLVELPNNEYHLLHKIEKINIFPIIASVVYLKQDGKIFVDNVQNPKVFFIIHKSSFSYLHNPNDTLNYDEFWDFFATNINVPQYIHIYDASSSLINYIQKRTGFNTRTRARMRMKGIPNFENLKNTANKQHLIKSINKIDIKTLDVFKLNFIKKYWNTIDDFLKEGFGWVIFENSNPISIWYTLCVVNHNCETDIFTLPEYRGKGLASITGNYILKTCLERGVNMDWDVFTDNIPSIRIGEKFGYKPYFYYDLLSVFNINTDNKL
jgi:GNAT superfamily N-acetyltransferase